MEEVNAYRILVAKPIRKQSVGRSRNRWEVNFKFDYGKINCKGKRLI
jgi:hypothetical protein